jgi:hypothetical protein
MLDLEENPVPQRTRTAALLIMACALALLVADAGFTIRGTCGSNAPFLSDEQKTRSFEEHGWLLGSWHNLKKSFSAGACP